MTSVTFAQEVVYVSGDEEGQGILRKSIKDCYLISPMHVIGFATEVKLIDSLRNSVLADLQSEYPSDLSVSKLKSPSSCRSQWSSSRWIKNDINEIEESILITRQADGSIKRRLVFITEFDDVYIRIRNKFKDESLFQGLSGSALVKNGRLLGQLMSIEPEASIGKVLRQDFIDGILKNRFGEGVNSINGAVSDGNLLSNNWEEFGNHQNRGQITINENLIELKYSGSGNNQINIGIKQNIPISGISNLRLSYHAGSSTSGYSNEDISYVGIELSKLDKNGKTIASIYSSPDKFLKYKTQSAKLKWIEGDNTWEIDRVFNKFNPNIKFDHLRLSLFVLTPKQERCSRCILEINDLKLFFDN